MILRQKKKKKKKRKWEGKSIFTENRLSRSEMWCATCNNNYMRHIYAKGFLDSNINYAVIDKISNFQEIAPNFTYPQQT